MEQLHFHSVWKPDIQRFTLKFGGVTWEIEHDKYKQMIEHAEQQLQARDGQNRLKRTTYKLQFHIQTCYPNGDEPMIELEHWIPEPERACKSFIADSKKSVPVEISLTDTESKEFLPLLEYLQKVYNGWHDYHRKDKQ